jgi:2-polyprenyl-3-methyl-5-hydroxy-6-metoxy-1,4-benzoquinol methylase
MRILARYIIKNIPKNAYILDAACGHGAIDKVLAKKGYKIKGIDLNPSRIKEIEPYIYEAECIDIDNLNGKEKFGLIVSLEMLEHVPDVKKTIANMFALLEENGKCIISVPYDRLIDDVQHVRFFTENSLIALLQDAGFNVKAIARLPYLNHEKDNDLICVCVK